MEGPRKESLDETKAKIEKLIALPSTLLPPPTKVIVPKSKSEESENVDNTSGDGGVERLRKRTMGIYSEPLLNSKSSWEQSLPSPKKIHLDESNSTETSSKSPTISIEIPRGEPERLLPKISESIVTSKKMKRKKNTDHPTTNTNSAVVNTEFQERATTLKHEAENAKKEDGDDSMRWRDLYIDAGITFMEQCKEYAGSGQTKSAIGLYHQTGVFLETAGSMLRKVNDLSRAALVYHLASVCFFNHHRMRTFSISRQHNDLIANIQGELRRSNNNDGDESLALRQRTVLLASAEKLLSSHFLMNKAMECLIRAISLDDRLPGFNQPHFLIDVKECVIVARATLNSLSS